MTKKYCILSIITSCITWLMIISSIFFSDINFASRTDFAKVNGLQFYTQKNPLDNNSSQNKAHLYFETVEDTEDDDDTVEFLFSTNRNNSDINVQVATILSNNKPVTSNTHNRLPLYILFHSWRGFDC